MKAGNIFLIILTSIITFIGLCLNKLYDKFVKKNIVEKKELSQTGSNRRPHG